MRDQKCYSIARRVFLLHGVLCKLFVALIANETITSYEYKDSRKFYKVISVYAREIFCSIRVGDSGEDEIFECSCQTVVGS